MARSIWGKELKKGENFMKNFSKGLGTALIVLIVGAGVVGLTASLVKSISAHQDPPAEFVYPNQDLSEVLLGKIDFRTEVTTTSTALAKARFDTMLSEGLSQGNSETTLQEEFVAPTTSVTEVSELISKCYVGNKALKMGTSAENGYFQINTTNIISKVVVKARNYYFEQTAGVYVSDSASIGIGATSAIETTELPKNTADTSIIPAVLDVSYSFINGTNTVYISAIDDRAIIYEVNFYTDAELAYSLVSPTGIISEEDEICNSVKLSAFLNIKSTNYQALVFDPELKEISIITATEEDAIFESPLCLFFNSDLSIMIGSLRIDETGLFEYAGVSYYLRDTFTGYLIANELSDDNLSYCQIDNEMAVNHSLVLYKQA